MSTQSKQPNAQEEEKKAQAGQPAAVQQTEALAAEAPAIDEEAELQRLQLLQQRTMQKREAAALEEIHAVCQKHRVALKAKPYYTEDGRTLCNIYVEAQ